MQSERVRYSAAVLTVSDRSARGEREDLAGPAVAAALPPSLFQVAPVRIVPDDRDRIAAALRELADTLGVALILTTGGTGLGPRDVTPEATLAVIERSVPGLPEAMRVLTLPNTRHAALSRAVAGIRGGSLILNLPGSPKGAVECLEAVLPVLPHALAVLRGDPAGHAP